MITRADASMLPRLKRIWQDCFADSAQGTEFVFAHLLDPSRMLVFLDGGGQPISMINWRMLPFTTPEAAFSGAYVFGVATLPTYRGRGISQNLMSELHPILVEEGAALSCLVPASASLFDFYSRQGFGRFFSYKRVSIDGGVLPEPEVEGVVSKSSLVELSDLRGEAFSDCSLFGAWDRDYLAFTDRDCRLNGGEVLRFSCRGKTGYAVCYPLPGGTLLVKEAVVDRGELGTLLGAIHNRYHARRYELRLREDFPGREWSYELLPFSMVKWYDEERRASTGSALGGAPWFAFGLD